MSARPPMDDAALAAWSQRLGWPLWHEPEPAMLEPAFDQLGAALAGRHACVLLRPRSPAGSPAPAHTAWIADPCDTDQQVWLESLVDTPLDYALGPRAAIQAYVAAHDDARHAATLGLQPQGADGSTAIAPGRLVLAAPDDGDTARPAVRLVDSLLYDAIRLGASDVHVEGTPAGLQCKYRIDGVLEDVSRIDDAALKDQVVSRIKVLAGLDIGERRVPQDGSLQVEALGRGIDLRVSVLPSVHGEDVVVRVLDKQRMLGSGQRLTLQSSGLPPHIVAELRALTAKPYGLFLVTGPTGSGKTTTLYGVLSELNNGRDKLITIEDPVEYQLPGVVQVPIHEKKGLTFARGLRSVLRHDPDRIMVGEIRDAETAEIAVQSSLTGHMVLSTVHANSALEVFGRFANLGVDLASFAAALLGISAQRLLRINCPRCAAPAAPDAELAERFALHAQQRAAGRFLRGRGCPACRGTGYQGRRAVAEVLRMDPAARELVVARQWGAPLAQHARERGFRGLREHAVDLVLEGATTLEEVARVVLDD